MPRWQTSSSRPTNSMASGITLSDQGRHPNRSGYRSTGPKVEPFQACCSVRIRCRCWACCIPCERRRPKMSALFIVCSPAARQHTRTLASQIFTMRERKDLIGVRLHCYSPLSPVGACLPCHRAQMFCCASELKQGGLRWPAQRGSAVATTKRQIRTIGRPRYTAAGRYPDHVVRHHACKRQ